MSTPKPFSIVSWYNGNMATANNVLIQNVLRYSDEELENRHDFIQLLFPLPWPSRLTNNTEVATQKNYNTIRGPGKPGRNFRMTMLNALKRILEMFDLELTPAKICTAHGTGPPNARHRNRGRRIRKITPVEGDGKDHVAREERLEALADPGNHHHHRITRIIRSLRLCGRPDEADSVYRFFRRFAREHRSLPRKALRMWGVAANSAYIDIDPSEDIKHCSKEIKMGEPSDGDIESVNSGTSDNTGNETSDKDTQSGRRGRGGRGGSGGGSGGGGGGGGGVFSDGGDGGGGGGGGGGSITSSSIEEISTDSDGGAFGPGGGDTTPPGGAEPGAESGAGPPKEIGDPGMSNEELRKLTSTEREFHHARIRHRNENIDIEIKLNLRSANGDWIGADEDPLKMSYLELRVWKRILKELDDNRKAEERRKSRIEEGNEPDDESSSDGSDDDDANDDKEFVRNDVKGFGQRDISDENLQKLVPWEKKLHLAQVEHHKDYLDIEMRHKFRDGDARWRGNGDDPIKMSLRELKKWHCELDRRESTWMDEVTAGERRWSQSVSSDSDYQSDYEIGMSGMSEDYFQKLGDEDKEKHLQLLNYNERFRYLEYKLKFRDPTTHEWIAPSQEPCDMTFDELDVWEVDMAGFEEEYNEKLRAEAAAANPTTETGTQAPPRLRSPEDLEMEEMMTERVRRGMDPLGDSPEARKWKATMEDMEREKAEKAEAARLEREGGGPGEQLRAEEAARAARGDVNSSRNKRRRLG